ncbi:MAG: pseudouridine synthase [Deltaproteobacteria bacterium]|nr:MAG: pseudouridine synthase [Pseudomonadota bacterium]PIE66319.1 MAG: pseudouridine synthase [Deltaproteobacteria bacterium]
MSDTMRLQRFLAQAGVASRRKSEQLIVAGKVSVNGRVVRELGTQVDPRADRVMVEGRRVLQQDHVWLVLHKPPNTISSTHDPEGRQTVLDLVPIPNVRLYPVGRLDWATSGVLLLTNDGLLAEQLLHPRHEIPRTYHVKVKGAMSIAELEKLREGIQLDNGRRATCEASLLASTGLHTWIEMTIKQGINHQIHKMLEAIEREVLKLIRVEFAGIRADELPPGRYRALTQREINELRNTFGLEGETRRVTAEDLGGRRHPRTAGAGGAKKAAAKRRKPTSSKQVTTRKPTTRKPTTKTSVGRKPTTKKGGAEKGGAKKRGAKKRGAKKR